MKKQHVDTNNARPGVYSEVIGNISESAICPFCPEHLRSIHPNPIDERENWIITDNAYPYTPKKQHILLIHKKHIGEVRELSESAWIELKEIIDEVSKKRNIHGGTFMMRFGETKFTGASVTHLHAHLFQSDPDSLDYNKKQGVLTRIG